MTDQKKRRRPRGGRGVTAGGQSASHDTNPIADAPPIRRYGTMAQWNWRTFPVFFALALGLFAGVYMGILAEYARSNGNGMPMNVVFITTALFFGFALSRVTSRFLVNRGIIKPRARNQA